MDVTGLPISALLEQHAELDDQIAVIRANQQVIRDEIIRQEAAAFTPGPLHLQQKIGDTGRA